MIMYGMLYATAVALPILFAALVGSAILRRCGRSERGIWLVALGLALTVPAIASLGRFGAISATPMPLPETGVLGLPAVVAVPVTPSGLGLDQVLGVLWLLASVMLALRWSVAAFRLERVSRSWRPETVDGISAWLTTDLGPAVSGVIRPRILVPKWLESLPQRQRSLVLLHEQEHVLARDPLLMAAARVARILTPWNPVVWMLASRLIRAVEMDCDRRVLRRRPDIQAYGRTLLTVSARDSGQLVAAAAFAESEAPLRNRILAMTTPPRTVSVLAILTSLVLGVVLLIGAFEIPVPSVRIEIVMDAAESGTGPVAATEREVAAEPEAPPAPTGASRPDSEPAPSLEAIVSRLRRESVVAPRRRESVVQQRVEPSEPDITAAPTFTPFTVAPSIRNRAEVVRAMEREYPALLRDAGIGGTVTVYFFIDENGRVVDFQVNESSGHQALDDAAIAVADIYRFTPALNRDKKVPVWVSFPITFQVR